MKIYNRFLVISLSYLISACAAIPPASSVNPWAYPNRHLRVPWDDSGQRRFIASLRPCIQYANDTFADALRRYESGQLGEAIFVVKALDDQNFFAWIIVSSASSDRVQGQISGRHPIDGRIYEAGAMILIGRPEIVDWYIIFKDRPPEGNFVGKYMLLKMDGLAPEDCDPSDAEFQHYRYFSMNYSFVPPGTEGWELRENNEDADMSMQEIGQSPYELNTLYAISYKAPEVATTREFVNLVRERGENTYKDDDRESIKKNDVEAYKKGNAMCVKSHQIIDDKKALLDKSGKRGPMPREVSSLYCINPNQKDMAVEVTYAHRYQTGNRDDNFFDKANKMFESFAFSRGY